VSGGGRCELGMTLCAAVGGMTYRRAVGDDRGRDDIHLRDACQFRVVVGGLACVLVGLHVLRAHNSSSLYD